MAALYRGMDRPTLDAAYNNGAAVASSAQIVADWQVRNDRPRSSASELRYGTAERNPIDLFQAVPGAPLFVFIHGGYLQIPAHDNLAPRPPPQRTTSRAPTKPPAGPGAPAPGPQRPRPPPSRPARASPPGRAPIRTSMQAPGMRPPSRCPVIITPPIASAHV